MRVCEIAEKLNLNDEPCTLYRWARIGTVMINIGFASFIAYFLLGQNHTLAFLIIFVGIYGVVIAVFLKINRRYEATKTWKLRVQEVAFMDFLPLSEILLAIIGIFFFHLLLMSKTVPYRITYSFYVGLAFAVIITIAVLKQRYGISVANNYPDSKERFIKIKHRVGIQSRKNFVRYGEIIIAYSGWEGEIRIYHVERDVEEVKKIMKIADSL